MAGQDKIARSMRMIVPSCHAIVEAPATTEWAISIANVHGERQACAATWRMPVRVTPVTPRRAVRPLRLTAMPYVPARRDGEVLHVTLTSMSVRKVLRQWCVSTGARAKTYQGHSSVTALWASLGGAVRRTSTNVTRIRVRMTEPVWTKGVHIGAFACQATLV